VGRYQVAPVHSIEEIELLHSRFPQNIRLFEATLDEDVVAGVTIFESPMVANVQYIASSSRGRATGALDALFHHLVENIFAAKPYFDFGISTEQSGRHLSHALLNRRRNLARAR
jgi:hypothetical protein